MLILVELVLVIATCCLYWVFARGRSPIGIFTGGLRRLLLEPGYRGAFLCMLALPLVDIVESAFDEPLTAALGYDMTPWIHRIEGDAMAWLQGFGPYPFVAFMTFAYIILLPVVMSGPLVLAAAEGQRRNVQALVVGLVGNYVVAIPFYIFFPVKEMWAGNPHHVNLLMDGVSPVIMEAYRANSALDNCFPSLHTSLALTAAIIASSWERPRVVWALWISSILVVFSTLYLGVHWACDMAAGVVLALAMGLFALAWRRRGAALQDAADAEAAARRADPEAAEILAAIGARCPGDARIEALLARSLAEQGKVDEALAAAERASPGLLPGAAAVLRAGILLDAGRRGEARSALEEGRVRDPGNVAVVGLLGVLDLEDSGTKDPRVAIERLPPGSLWCESVLGRLVLVLERTLEGRGCGDGVSARFHEARSALVRPRFDKEALRPFLLEGIGDLLRGRRAREDRRREAAIRAALRSGDMRKAAEAAEAWRKDSPSGDRVDDLRATAMEIAFLEDRFADVLRLDRERRSSGSDDGDLAALAAYAAIAAGKSPRALESLAPHLRADPRAEVLHLASIAELQLGRLHRAAGLLCRAAARDDVAMVRLAREEAAFLSGCEEGRDPSREEPREAAHPRAGC
jgi:membrane-associated phospholipid phosphatase